MNLKFIRGARILQQLNPLVERTYTALKTNVLNFTPKTKKRQLATAPISIGQLKFTTYEATGDLKCTTTVNNPTSDGEGKYVSVMMFTGVEYEDEDTADNITFMGTDNATHNIKPINLSQHDVKLSCTCLDFYWRFAAWNNKDGSLHGPPPKPYVKTTDRPSVNPNKVPGLCKHLLKSVVTLQGSGVIDK